MNVRSYIFLVLKLTPCPGYLLQATTNSPP